MHVCARTCMYQCRWEYICLSSAIYSHAWFIEGGRAMHVHRLTSLLTELLGQSILENDLSAMCCCGAEEEKEKEGCQERNGKERRSIDTSTNSATAKVNWSVLNMCRLIQHRWHHFPLKPTKTSSIRGHFLKFIMM